MLITRLSSSLKSIRAKLFVASMLLVVQAVTAMAIFYYHSTKDQVVKAHTDANTRAIASYSLLFQQAVARYAYNFEVQTKIYTERFTTAYSEPSFKGFFEAVLGDITRVDFVLENGTTQISVRAPSESGQKTGVTPDQLARAKAAPNRVTTDFVEVDGRIYVSLFIIRQSFFDEFIGGFHAMVPFKTIDRALAAAALADKGSFSVLLTEPRHLYRVSDEVPMSIEPAFLAGATSCISGQDDCSFTGRFDGVPSLIAIQGDAKMKIAFILSLPEEVILRRLRQSLLNVIAIALVLSAITFFLVGIVSRRLTNPLLLLTKAAARIGKGDYTVKLAPQGEDEVASLSLAFNEMAEGLRQREVLRSSFSKYVEAPVVDQILKSEGGPTVGGHRRELTTFFLDLAGFTTFVESTEEHEVVAELNTHLNQITKAIRLHSGTIDKFVGDAVMAFWNAPLETADHAELACRAALHIQKQGMKLKVRIGINTGEAIVGNVGSEDRMQYTAIGDAVNVASRLEGLNKRYESGILISESTASRLRNRNEFLFRNLGEVALKGKAQSVSVYELLCYRADASASDIEFSETFNRALADFCEGRWSEALPLFARCQELWPHDRATMAFVKNCEYNLSNTFTQKKAV